MSDNNFYLYKTEADQVSIYRSGEIGSLILSGLDELCINSNFNIKNLQNDFVNIGLNDQFFLVGNNKFIFTFDKSGQGEKVYLYQLESGKSLDLSLGNQFYDGNSVVEDFFDLSYRTGNLNLDVGVNISGNLQVTGTGIFNALDLNNIDNLSLSGVDVTITSGVVALTNRPTVNGTGVLLSGQSPAISDSLVTHIRPSGTNNVFVSSTALASTSIDSQNNIAVGVNALTANDVGDDNVAMGHEALYSNTNGNGNIGIGRDALKNANSPDANICIGTQAGDTIQEGGSNIIIGHEADVDQSWRQRCIVLGRSAVSPALDGSLSIGGDGGNAMNGLTTGTAGEGATSYLRIWLNGLEYRILIQRP
jgi:hypothetical protein